MRFNRFLSLLMTVFMFTGLLIPAQACTAIYAGAELTETGDTVFGRIEDFSSDYPKLFDLYPAGAHQAGEVYQGCYGFSWTFTHDSYSYTGFCEDNSQGVCPDCNGTHEHTPYQSGGTNECGLSVTATETATKGSIAITEQVFQNVSPLAESRR